MKDLAKCIDRDNQYLEKIYNHLFMLYEVSAIDSAHRPLAAYFFFDILTLVSRCHLLSNEIRFGKTLEKTSVDQYPYIDYEFVKRPKVKQISCENLKKIPSTIDFYHIRNGSKGVLVESSIFRREVRFLGRLKSRVLDRAKLVRVDLDREIIPNSTVDFLASCVESLCDEFAELLQFRPYLKALVESHAHVFRHPIPKRSMLERVCSGKKIFFMAGSADRIARGFATSSSMLDNVCHFAVCHGEAYGCLDEPLFGRYGEFTNVDGFVGYGESLTSIASEQSRYLPQNGNMFQYFRDSRRVARIKGEVFRRNVGALTSDLDEATRYIYFPTSFSGKARRYGPFRDCSDFDYLAIRSWIKSLFGDNLWIKEHPKNPSETAHISLGSPKRSLDQALNSDAVYIFDYVSTCFFEACATKSKVVFFDFGIRNIGSQAKLKIKKRCVYFDMKQNTVTREEIDDRLAHSSTDYDSLDSFSLSLSQNGPSDFLSIVTSSSLPLD